MTNKEAIERIKFHRVIHKMDEQRAVLISEAIDMAIEALEQKHGEWKVSELGYPYCSKCGTALTKSAPRTNFCSNCGADMREGDEE